MSSPQHFECLEEEEITGHSNTPHFVTRYKSFGGGRNYTVLNGTQTKNRAVAIDKLRREVELRGSQTPP